MQVENEIKWQQFRSFVLQLLLWEVAGTELGFMRTHFFEINFVDFIR